MEFLKNFDLKVKKFFGEKQNKKARFILILGCAGIMLIVLSEVVPQNKPELKDTKESFLSTSEKESELEKRIEDAISKIKGVGQTDVTITLDSSDEFYYAKNSYENIDEAEVAKEYELVLIEGENGEEPLLIKTSEAKIRGVLIICEGGNNSLVCEKIIEAVCALLNIPSNKVSVAEMA